MISLYRFHGLFFIQSLLLLLYKDLTKLDFSPSRVVLTYYFYYIIRFMKSNDNIRDQQVIELYDRIDVLLGELGIRWADLAKLMDLSPKTLSSMKSQKVNPSWTTIRKIATALDISPDELIDDESKTPELHELYQEIPKIIKNHELQITTCKQCITMARVCAGITDGKKKTRLDERKIKIRNKLNSIKSENGVTNGKTV